MQWCSASNSAARCRRCSTRISRHPMPSHARALAEPSGQPAPEGTVGQPVGVLALNTRGRRFDQGDKLMTVAPAALSGSPTCAMAGSERQHVAGAQLGCSKPAVRQVQQLAGIAANNHQLTGIFSSDDRFQAASRQFRRDLPLLPVSSSARLVQRRCTDPVRRPAPDGSCSGTVCSNAWRPSIAQRTAAWRLKPRTTVQII